jgi:hypothetical protein
MANHKGEPECITCRFHEVKGTRIFCKKYSSEIPTELGPYLICRLWQGQDGKTLDENWKNKHLPLEDVLYKHDIYRAHAPKVVKKFG